MTRKRTVSLVRGRSPQIQPNTLGADEATLVLHGWTKHRGEHEVRIALDEHALEVLALDLRRHFAHLTKRLQAIAARRALRVERMFAKAIDLATEAQTPS